VLNYLTIFNVKPDLLLIAVVILGLLYSAKWVVAFSFFSGFLKDIFGSGPVGLNTFIFLLIGYSVYRLSKEIIIETLPLRIAVIGSGVILENIIALCVLSFYSNPSPLGIFLRVIFLATIYTASVAPLVIKLII
jgi:rod shape-determining protein MreD